jgi:hypothetical protein
MLVGSWMGGGGQLVICNNLTYNFWNRLLRIFSIPLKINNYFLTKLAFKWLIDLTTWGASIKCHSVKISKVTQSLQRLITECLGGFSTLQNSGVIWSYQDYLEERAFDLFYSHISYWSGVDFRKVGRTA